MDIFEEYIKKKDENSMEMGKRKPIQYGKRKVSTFLANEEKKRLLKSGKDILTIFLKKMTAFF